MYAAIILMAGQSARLKGAVPKQYRLLHSKKVYQHTLERFRSFSEIILVVSEPFLKEIEEPGVRVVLGGATRRESTYQGLLACTSPFVVIHDAVRPFVSERIIEEHKAALKSHPAIDTCIPSHDTIVVREGQHITAIPDRSLYWRGQTPQSFSYGLIRRAHEEVPSFAEHVDDCRLVLELGVKPFIVLGEERNMKITTEDDWQMAQKLYTNHFRGDCCI